MSGRRGVSRRGSFGALLFVSVAFAATRVLFHRAGIRFDASMLGIYWQLLDEDLLAGDLARSLLYLHAQPPLYNLLVGIALKLSPGDPAAILHGVHVACGLGCTLAIFALMRRLGASSVTSAATAVVFAANPGFILYENVSFYTIAELFLLSASALLLHRYASGWRRRDGLGFFAALAALVLVRASFHVGWLVLVALLVAAVSGRRRFRRVLAHAAVPALVAVLWYGKNLVLFGSFSASTWLGMNMARIAVVPIPGPERAALVTAGVLTPLARTHPFMPLEDYGVPLPPPTGIPALDAPTKRGTQLPNFNHLAYVDLSRRYLAESWRAMRARPRAYLGAVKKAFVIFLAAPSERGLIARNRRHIEAYTRRYDRLFYAERGGIRFAMLGSFLVSIAFVLTHLSSRAPSPRARAAVFVFMGVTIVYVALTGTLLELGENNRFRFPIDPFLAMLVVLAASAAARKAARWAWSRAA